MEGHVVPTKEDHKLSVFCRCKPVTEEIEGNLLVIHSSFDQREVIERAQSILGVKAGKPDSWALFIVEDSYEAY